MRCRWVHSQGHPTLVDRAVAALVTAATLRVETGTGAERLVEAQLSWTDEPVSVPVRGKEGAANPPA